MTVFATRLAAGAAQLQIPLTSRQLAQLEVLVDELVRWNRAYNLTAITAPLEILTHHLLDSLTAQPALQGERIADVGTGAGFPGLPLAIINPDRQFTLIDAVDKKLRFVNHAARALQLKNVRSVHARVEKLPANTTVDTVIARAFAPLPRLIAQVAPLCSATTRVVAMKGHWPEPNAPEPLPPGWRIESVLPVQVPGLDESRHLVLVRRSAVRDEAIGSRLPAP